MQIYLPDSGFYRTADRLALELEITVLSLNGESWQLEPRQLGDVRPLGRLPALLVRSRLGRRLLAPADWRLLTLAGWQPIERLAPGAFIALPRRLPGPAEPSLQKREIELAAWLLSDHWRVEQGLLRYELADEAQAQELAGLVRRVFGRAARLQASDASQRRLALQLSEPIVAWLSGMGYWQMAAEERRVPEQVLAQPTRGVNQFLRQLWRCGGALAVARGHAPRVCYCAPGEDAARDVQSLLLRLGINAVVAPPAADEEQSGVLVHLSGKHDLRRFARMLGTRMSERQERSLLAIKEYFAEYSAVTSRDLLPRETWQRYAVPALLGAGMSETQVQAALGYPTFVGSRAVPLLSRERAAQLAWLLRSDELDRLARSDVYWDDIVAIEAGGVIEAYALDGAENVVADDFLLAGPGEGDAP